MDPITPVEVNDVAQPVVEVARDMWEDDALANCLLAQLKTLKVEAIPAGGRPVPQSYKRWSALDAKQRDKVKLFHNSCSNAVQSVVVSRARNFLADELAAAELAANAATMRTENTTKSDYARAIHIYNDPRLVGFFVEAYSPVVERAILDDNQDRTDMSGGWKKIDDAFNDYVSYTYQNATIRYAQPIDMDGVLGGHPIKMVPYQARSDELVGMADRCHALDPSDSSRPVRDIAWIKDLYRKLRAELSKLRQSYHKSGNMDAEDQNAEWLKFCGNVPDWAAYAFVVLEDAAMDQLGKAKPEDSQMDTGVLGRGGRKKANTTNTDEETPSSKKKRRIRSALQPETVRPLTAPREPSLSTPLATPKGHTVSYTYARGVSSLATIGRNYPGPLRPFSSSTNKQPRMNHPSRGWFAEIPSPAWAPITAAESSKSIMIASTHETRHQL